MKPKTTGLIQLAKYGYLAMSVFLSVIGILLLHSPETGAYRLMKWVGIICILFGGIRIVGYFSKDLFRLAFRYDLEYGIFLMLVGILMVVFSGEMTHIIAVLFGLAVLMDGILRIRMSMEARRFGIQLWWVTLVLAISACAVGGLLLFRHMDAAVLGMITGITCLADGILNFAVALSVVKIVRHQLPDERSELKIKKYRL